MTQLQEVALPNVPAKRSSSRKPLRLFYAGAAVLMAVLTFLGFYKFYLHGMSHPGREIPPPIRTLVITHGVSMTAWIALMMAQPLLIAGRKHRIHMQLGKAGALLAAVILVSGVWIAVGSARVTPPEVILWGLPPKEFMAVPLIGILVFAAFVTLGVVYRRTPSVHRSMMLLATLAALPAAVSRIEPLNSLYVGTMAEQIFGPFLMTLIFAGVLLAIRCAMTRSLDRSFAFGLLALTAACIGTMQLAPTAAWLAFAELLVP